MDLPWEGGGEFPWRRLFFGPPDEVYMKRKPRGAVALAGVLLGALIAMPASGQDVDALIDAELNRLEQARRNQAQINQIAEQTRQRFDEYQILVKEIEGLRVYNDLMQARVDDQNRQLDELRASIDTVTVIERQVVPLMTRMIDGLEHFIELDVPFRQAERKARIQFLRNLLTQSDVSTAEQFRFVIQAWQTEMDYGMFADTYPGEIEIDGTMREVDFFMLGRIGLYYVTPDDALAGGWDQRTREWVRLTRADAEDIRAGIDVIGGGAPQLLMLPIAPPQEN